MIIIGDEDISFDKFVSIDCINDIKHSQANSTVCFSYSIKLINHCNINNINYAVIVQNITDAIYSNSLNARYILSLDYEICSSIQSIADAYLFDSKNLLVIKDKNDIEKVALQSIDGVVFSSILA